MFPDKSLAKTPMGRSKIIQSIVIRSTADVVFDFTQDYDQRLSWDTFLKRAELIGTTEADVGVKAWCVSKHGLGMETEYVSFNRPKVTAVRQSKPSTLFKDFSGSWKYENINHDEVQVTFTYSYLLRGFFDWFSWIIHRILLQNVKQRLKDLKSVVEGFSGKS